MLGERKTKDEGSVLGNGGAEGEFEEDDSDGGPDDAARARNKSARIILHSLTRRFCDPAQADFGEKLDVWVLDRPWHALS